MDPDTQARQLIKQAAHYRAEGLAKEALAVLHQAYEVAEQIQYNSGSKVFVIETIAREYEKLGEKKRALEMLSVAVLEAERIDFSQVTSGAWAKPMDVGMQCDCLEMISHSYARLGEIEKALQLVRMIEFEGHRRLALCWIIEVLCERGDLDKAHEVAQLLPRSKNCGLAEVGVAYAMAGKVEQALQVAGELEEYGRASSLAKIAAALVDVQHIESAQQLLDCALEAARSLEKDGWSAREVLSLVPVLCAIGSADRARDLLAEVIAIAATAQTADKSRLDEEIKKCRKRLECLQN